MLRYYPYWLLLPLRPEGYYWVKRLYSSEWSLATETKSRGVWMYIYPHMTIEDSVPFEIGHRIPSNDELGKMQEELKFYKAQEKLNS